MLPKILGRLKDRQIELARDALAKPAAYTEFEYGRVSGIYAGLQMALDLIDEVLSDRDDEGERGAGSRRKDQFRL